MIRRIFGFVKSNRFWFWLASGFVAFAAVLQFCKSLEGPVRDTVVRISKQSGDAVVKFSVLEFRTKYREIYDRLEKQKRDDDAYKEELRAKIHNISDNDVANSVILEINLHYSQFFNPFGVKIGKGPPDGISIRRGDGIWFSNSVDVNFKVKSISPPTVDDAAIFTETNEYITIRKEKWDETRRKLESERNGKLIDELNEYTAAHPYMTHDLMEEQARKEAIEQTSTFACLLYGAILGIPTLFAFLFVGASKSDNVLGFILMWCAVFIAVFIVVLAIVGVTELAIRSFVFFTRDAFPWLLDLSSLGLFMSGVSFLTFWVKKWLQKRKASKVGG